MSETEQLYGLWYDEYDRWARVSLPYDLATLHKQNTTYAPNLIFFSLKDVQLIAQYTGDVGEPKRFSIRPSTYTGLTEEEKLAKLFKAQDDKRRLEHAMKYL